MAARCGCGSLGNCNCLILAGDNVTVTGVGTPADPYIVTGATPFAAAQTLLLSGTGNYTIPDDATTLYVEGMGGGTGGGSGRRGAAGTVRAGGGGGGGAALTIRTYDVAQLVAANGGSRTFAYQVGPGTAGGAAQTVDDNNGNPGASPSSAVNATFLGAFFRAAGGATPGGGGTNATGAGGAPGIGTSTGAIGGVASATGGAGAPPGFGQGGNGGGSGGGITTGNTANNGSVGQRSDNVALSTPGQAGVVDTTPPTSGSAQFIAGVPGVSPGGGAASITTAAQAGASALPNTGAGGAGGGASLNGNNSGAGGAGGSGYLRIIASA